MKITLPAATALAVALIASPAFADTSDIRASDRAAEFDVGAGYQKYGESVNDASFDTETGWMPYIGAGFTWVGSENSKSGAMFDNMYGHIEANVMFGDDHYNGGIQHLHGPTTPFQSTTSNTIFNIDGQIGHLFELTDGVTLIPLVDIGYRTWSRDIGGGGIVSNSNEDYSTGLAMGGLLLQVSPMPGLVLSASGEGGTTFGPELRANDTTYNLNATPAWKFGGKIGYTFAPNWEVTTGANMVGFGFQHSQVINGAYEPNSYTHDLTATAGIAYHLH